MSSEMYQIEPFSNGFEGFVPSISIDCVVLGYRQKSLHVLLLRFKHSKAWALPGGFLANDEEMEDAVNRVLLERTGLKNIFLRQFHTFSSLKRNRRWEEVHNDSFFHESFHELPEATLTKIKAWFAQRFITTGFLALVDTNKVIPTPDWLSDACKWVPINDLPELVLDHREILERAMLQLKLQLNYWPIGISLLPDKFTMMDLQAIYETILHKSLDRANFQRKILKLNMLKRHEKLMTGAANKAPYLYSFDEEIYFRLKEEGIGFSLS